MVVERRDDSCVEDMMLMVIYGNQKTFFLSACVDLIFTIRMINHGHPFPSSFRAGVEKEQ